MLLEKKKENKRPLGNPCILRWHRNGFKDLPLELQETSAGMKVKYLTVSYRYLGILLRADEMASRSAMQDLSLAGTNRYM